MNYKVGDKVVVKTLEELKGFAVEYSTGRTEICHNGITFVHDMNKFCGKEFEVKKVLTDGYILSECGGWFFQDWMLNEARSCKNCNYNCICEDKYPCSVCKRIKPDLWEKPSCLSFSEIVDEEVSRFKNEKSMANIDDVDMDLSSEDAENIKQYINKNIELCCDDGGKRMRKEMYALQNKQLFFQETNNDKVVQFRSVDFVDVVAVQFADVEKVYVFEKVCEEIIKAGDTVRVSCFDGEKDAKCLGVLKIPRKQIRVLLGAFMQVGNDKVSNNLAKCIGVYKKEKVEQTVLKG